MTRPRRYPPELRERAIRLVREHRGEHPSEWVAIRSIAGKPEMTPERVWLWLRRDELDPRQRPGVTSTERGRLRELERGNRELRRANEILKAASACFTCGRRTAACTAPTRGGRTGWPHRPPTGPRGPRRWSDSRTSRCPPGPRAGGPGGGTGWRGTGPGGRS